MATVTPTGDNSALRAYRGQVPGMRFGKMLSGTRLVESHTGVPKSEAGWRKPVGLAVPPDPRKLKTILLFGRITMLQKLLIFIATAALIGCITDTTPMTCAFDNIHGVYFTTRGELLAHSRMITVTRDGRTFMFERYKVTICQETE